MREWYAFVRRRSGLTLVEVMIALTIVSLLVISSQRILQQTEVTTRAFLKSVSERDASANGQRLLRELFIQSYGGWKADSTRMQSGEGLLKGDAMRIEFTSLCIKPSGWAESCRVQLWTDECRPSLEGTRRHCAVWIATDSGRSVPILKSATPLEFRFLQTASNGGSWTSQWRSAASFPIAVGVVSATDTTLFRIGTLE